MEQKDRPAAGTLSQSLSARPPRSAVKVLKKDEEKLGLWENTLYICSNRFGSVKSYSYISTIINTKHHDRRRSI